MKDSHKNVFIFLIKETVLIVAFIILLTLTNNRILEKTE